MRDVQHQSKATASLDPAVRTADATGTGVDLQGVEGALVQVQVGAEGDTLTGELFIEFELEESDDNVTFTDVADADVVGTVSGTNSGTIAKIDAVAEAPSLHTAAYIGTKRYLRVVDSRTGTHTTGTATAASVIGMLARMSPAS